jgi:hypothetical protein
MSHIQMPDESSQYLKWLELMSSLQIVLPTMVHLTGVGVTKSAGHLKVMGTEGLSKLSRGGTMGDQVVPVTVVRKSSSLN